MRYQKIPQIRLEVFPEKYKQIDHISKNLRLQTNNIILLLFFEKICLYLCMKLIYTYVVYVVMGLGTRQCNPSGAPGGTQSQIFDLKPKYLNYN